MTEHSLFQYTGHILHLLIQVIIVAAAIILVVKNQNFPTILILTGAILSGLMQVVTPFLYNYYSGITEDFLQLTVLISLISGLFYAIFGVGLFILAIRFKKEQIN